jgi:hypothetical protein
MRYVTHRAVALARYRTRLAKDDWRESRLSEPDAVMRVARILVTAENPSASPFQIEELVARRMRNPPNYKKSSQSKPALTADQINADRRRLEDRSWRRQ